MEDASFIRLLRVSRWLGIAPYRFLYHPEISWRFLLYSRMLFLYLVAMEVQRLRKQIIQWFSINSSQSQQQFTSLMTILWSVSFGTILFSGMWKASDRIRRIFHYMKSINKIYESIGHIRSSDPSSRQVWLLFSIMQALTTPLIVYETYKEFMMTKTMEVYSLALSNISIAYAFFISNMIMMHFLLMTAKINSLFRSINDQLENILNKALSKDKRSDKLKHAYSIGEEKDGYNLRVPISKINITIDLLGTAIHQSLGDFMLPHKKLHTLSTAYVATCAVVRQINDSEELLLLSQFINIVLILMSYTCNIIISISNLDVVFWYIDAFSWYIVHCLRAMMLVSPNHRIQNEADRARSLIWSLMHIIRMPGDPLLAELEVYLTHLNLNQPAYIVLGTYTLRRSLVGTLMAIVITCVAFFE